MAPQIMYGYVQSQGQHQHHTHAQQQQQQQQQQAQQQSQQQQQDPSQNSAFSSGILSTVTPFTPSSHQNQQKQNQPPISEHMNEQLKAFDESKRAHQSMTEQHQPHFFARARAAENRGVGPVLTSITTSNTAAATADGAVDGEEEDRGRPVNVEKAEDRQDWQSLDLSGQGLRAISLTLFDRYAFVEELYLCSNNLRYLPPSIGQLRKLRHLDLSHNHLTELPPELGMCTPLRKLLVFNNQIQELPYELGALHFLELLGVQGNPLNNETKQMLIDDGTKGLINHLKESAPGEFSAKHITKLLLTKLLPHKYHFLLTHVNLSPSKKGFPQTWSICACFRGTHCATGMPPVPSTATHPRGHWTGSIDAMP
jgi:CCR4-NOT transcription complex subunit 6